MATAPAPAMDRMWDMGIDRMWDIGSVVRDVHCSLTFIKREGGRGRKGKGERVSEVEHNIHGKRDS